MRFSRCPRYLQTLFAICTIYSISSSGVNADELVLKNGQVVTGDIVGFSGGSIQIKIASGEIAHNQANVQEIRMPVPDAYKEGLDAYNQQDYATALAKLKPVADKFKGLDTEWAQQTTALMGDLYLSVNDVSSAETAFQDFQKLYPDVQGASRSVIGMARIDVLNKKYAEAKEKLEPIATQALSQPGVSSLEGAAYGQAFYLLGQIHEAEGNNELALQNYLRTVAVFPQDKVALANAQERAEAIRKENNVKVP